MRKNKKFSKSMIAIMLSIVGVLSSTLPTTAGVLSFQNPENQEYVVSEQDGLKSIVMPRWTHIGIISTGLTIDDNGKAVSHIAFSALDGKNVCKISAELRQLKKGYWNKIGSWNAQDVGGAAFTGVRYVDKGYRYDLDGVCEVWNSKGTKLLESQDVTYTKTF